MQTILWILLLGVVLLYFVMRSGGKGVINASPEDFKRGLDENKNKILIDVRSPNEYRSGHIPTAVNIPVQELGHCIGDVAKDKQVFVYCQSGMRSRQAGRILAKHGFTDIMNLRGGILSWHGKLQK